VHHNCRSLSGSTHGRLILILIVCTSLQFSSLERKISAIANGEDDPEKLANFARRTMKRKKEELELALQGYVNPHQRLMLKTILTHNQLITVSN
jgi:transposase